MGSKSDIVAGGGWRERRDYRVKFKAVSCLVLSVPALASSDGLGDRVGAWSLCIPALLITVTAILFWFERPAIFWGFPDAQWRDLDRALSGAEGTSSNGQVDGSAETSKPCPEYDPRKLY